MMGVAAAILRNRENDGNEGLAQGRFILDDIIPLKIFGCQRKNKYFGWVLDLYIIMSGVVIKMIGGKYFYKRLYITVKEF